MCSLGRSVWKYRPTPSQRWGFIIHFRTHCPLKYKRNQLALYSLSWCFRYPCRVLLLTAFPDIRV